jgi:hypothetical protein
MGFGRKPVFRKLNSFLVESARSDRDILILVALLPGLAGRCAAEDREYQLECRQS